LIHEQIENCLEQAVGPLAREQRGPVEEFKAITSISEGCRSREKIQNHINLP
jgi:hypothetical protein